MKTVSLKIATAAMAFACAGTLAQAADMSAPAPYQDDERNGVKIGMLECDIGGGLGYLIGSAKELSCTFRSTKGRVETYTGNIKKLGVDVGWTREGKLLWAVFAPVAGYHHGALSGLYLGATAEATAIVGVGTNVLVGGTGGSIALQMISVTGQTGLNAAAGGAALTLVPTS
ncbi:MAG TPA: DUF992 domain-containing protein [Kaistia sp.]|nr:DUF992 domain-containing protein [Kaistia sp.]